MKLTVALASNLTGFAMFVPERLFKAERRPALGNRVGSSRLCSRRYPAREHVRERVCSRTAMP